MRTIYRDNYTPKLGDYHDRLIIDGAQEKKWVFDCDGVYTEMDGAEVVNEKGGSTTKAVSQKLFTDETNSLAQDISDEANTRSDADRAIWAEIEEIEAASDVTDVVGTYADLEAYDTSKLKDNDIIKVLEDETQDNQITYYRWDKDTSTFSLIGAIGPYYTQAQADAKFQDKLTAGANVTIDANNEISATDTTYTAGANITIDANNEISATNTTYTAGANIAIDADNVISATDTTYSNFTGTDGVDPGTAGLVPAPAVTDYNKYLKSDGTWDTVSAGPTVVQTYGTSQTDVMSQKATTDLVYTGADPKKINIGDNGVTGATNSIIIGFEDSGTITGRADQIIIGHNITDHRPNTIGIGHSITFGSGSSTTDKNTVAIGNSVTADATESVVIGHSAYTTGSECTLLGHTAKGTSSTTAVGTSSEGASNATAIGASAKATGSNAVAVGYGAQANQSENVAVGTSALATNASGNNAFGDQAQATATGGGALAVGFGARAIQKGSAAIGATSKVMSGRTGVISVGNCDNDTRYCYGGTVYRIIEGVHDGIQLHDAATVAQGNTLATSAPTTTTAGVLGQLVTDTTGVDLYQCTAIDTTDPDNPVYTWTQVGGGSGPTVVQTTGTSQTDVMSQEATSQLIYPSGYETTKNRIVIGSGASISTTTYTGQIAIGVNATSYNDAGIAIGSGSTASGTNPYHWGLIAIGTSAGSNSLGGIAIGYNAKVRGAQYSTAIGMDSESDGDHSVALGYSAKSNATSYSVALGTESKPRAQGVVDVSTGTNTHGYQGTADQTRTSLRVISGVHDPEQAQDAATKNYVDTAVAAAPVITMTSTDPGEGQPLADNSFIAVY